MINRAAFHTTTRLCARKSRIQRVPNNVADDIFHTIFKNEARIEERKQVLLEKIPAIIPKRKVKVRKPPQPSSFNDALIPISTSSRHPQSSQSATSKAVASLYADSTDSDDVVVEDSAKADKWYEGTAFNIDEKELESTLEFVPKWMKNQQNLADRANESAPNHTTAASAASLEYSSERLLNGIVEALTNERGNNIAIVDIREKTDMGEYLVIVDGRSKKQIYALADAAKRYARKFVSLGSYMMPEYLAIEGDESEDWMVLDCGAVIVHCFSPEGRKMYDLQSLWENMDAFVEEVENQEQDNTLDIKGPHPQRRKSSMR